MRLREHCAAGRLTIDELEERSAAAYTAHTVAELAALARDLPAERQLATTVVERIVAVLGDAEQGGSWRVPERLLARAVLGDCRVDLRQAELPREGVTIEAQAILGNVRILVPRGVRVDMTGSSLIGNRKVRGDNPAPAAGAPVVHVDARAILGDVIVDVMTPSERALRTARSLLGRRRDEIEPR